MKNANFTPEQLEAVLDMLMRQRFCDWYNNEFDTWIKGFGEDTDGELIIKSLKEMLQ